MEVLAISRLPAFAQKLLASYIDGKLPARKVAQELATALEIDAVLEVVARLVSDGRMTQEEADTLIEEMRASRTVENGVAATSATCAGGAAALTAVSASGSVAGLSAAGITSGLAALGGLVGGGMAAGLLVTAGAAFVVGAGTFWAAKKIVRRGKKLIPAARE